jgi:hypothetical protein
VRSADHRGRLTVKVEVRVSQGDGNTKKWVTRYREKASELTLLIVWIYQEIRVKTVPRRAVDLNAQLPVCTERPARNRTLQ